MATPAQRRAVYKYYRDKGYSAKEARNMRNRTKAVLFDWIDTKRAYRKAKEEGVAVPKVPKPPVAVITRADMLRIRKKLVSVGISKRAAYNMTRSREKAINAEYNIEKTLESLGKPTRRKAKKAYKDMMKRWAEAQKTADVYKAIETDYADIVGVPSWPDPIECPKCGERRIMLKPHKRYTEYKCRDCKHVWKAKD